MSSMFKRVTLPLLALTAAATLCAPTRAATATWSACGADPNSTEGILERVDCSQTDTGQWTNDVFHNNLLGGGDDNVTPAHDVGISGPGDYTDPSSPFQTYGFTMHSHGTYNCWCICNGGNSGGPWAVSTGGTYYVTR